MFRQYQHIERISDPLCPEIDGLLGGECYVYPKLDGSNHQVWYDEDEGCVICASHHKVLTEENDNTGFLRYFRSHPELMSFCDRHRDLTLCGEFLTPHTIRTYTEDAWNVFYVFDVYRRGNEEPGYLPYEEYSALTEEYGIPCIPPIRIFTPSENWMEELVSLTDENRYLMQEGFLGEGIVVKRYGFRNRYGRTIWGKIVREEFREKSSRPDKGERPRRPEDDIINATVTDMFVSKEFHKFVEENGEWNRELIPVFLRYSWYQWWIDFSFEHIATMKNTDMKRLRSDFSNRCIRILTRITEH